MSSTVEQTEIEKFAKDSSHWWNENGPFAPLHRLNPARLSYIKAQICAHYERDDKAMRPFDGLSVLDIGCGGGLVCEPMARMGAKVTGADADTQAIEVAKEHAKASGLDIKYRNTTAESLLSSLHGLSLQSMDHTDKPCDDVSGYNVVLALEIIEHVSDPAEFVENCAKLVKPGGLIIFSTLNRNPKSFLLGVVAAEYLLRWVPTGTHNWKKFIKPSELSRFCRAANLTPHDICGLMFHPLEQAFKLSKTDIDVNYFLTAKA